ncbi:EAL domain-containing protein [Chloroflexales bacterium ZM16-3]|nr:EAL domain-containing protein [Chloroflexales bacterium ZM16-3]
MKEGYSSITNQIVPLNETPIDESAVLRAITTQSDDSLLVLDSDGIVRFANPAAEALFGRSRDHLVGFTFGFPIVTHETTDLEIIRPSGSVVMVAMHIQSITLEGGPAFLATLYDITERKRTEQLLIESQQFLRSTLDALSAHIAILDGAGTIMAVNHAWQAFARSAGHNPYSSGVGYNYLSVCDAVSEGEDALIAHAAAAGIRAVIAGTQTHFHLDYPCHFRDRQMWFTLRVTRFGDDEHVRVVAAHEDITRRMQAEILSNERRQVLELVARSQKIDVVSQQILTMISHRYPGMIYMALVFSEAPVQHIASPDLSADMLEQLEVWARARVGDSLSHRKIERYLPGNARWAEINAIVADIGVADCWIAPIRTHTGQVDGVLVLAHHEITHIGADDTQVIELAEQLLMIALEQQEHTRQMAYQAHHDALTGLPNRLLFEERLHQAIEATRRSGRMIAVLFIDLDRFKQINDTLGHTIGDALLIQLARRFESYVRSADTIARRGGDEFMMVLTEITGSLQVSKVAHRLHELLHPPFHIAGNELFVSASIGASMYPADGEDADSLQRCADVAMYRAKSTMRNSFQFFDSATNRTALEHLRLENYLRRALERNELDTYYQPKVDRSGRIVGMESLLRWKHPDMGIIPPSRFIPLAEDLGLIIPFNAWCMANAFRQARRWQRPDRPLFISANVSIIQFSQPDFVESLSAIVAESGLDPSLIVLELTESMLIGDQSSVAQMLNKLCDIGLTLAIDDFGTGYSSLAYLRRLPISILKIDRSFVFDIGTERDDSGRAIINAIMNLAHQLGMRVVAEGVETVTQRDFLHSAGCDMIQGYFYSEPLPQVLFEHLLRDDHLPGPTWKE